MYIECNINDFKSILKNGVRVLIDGKPITIKSGTRLYSWRDIGGPINQTNIEIFSDTIHHIRIEYSNDDMIVVVGFKYNGEFTSADGFKHLHLNIKNTENQAREWVEGYSMNDIEDTSAYTKFIDDNGYERVRMRYIMQRTKKA